MKIREIIDLVQAKVLTEGSGIDREIQAACGSDMMSDVLAYVKNQGLLVTGLNNPQVIRTADMMDILCVLFVRGKLPDGNMIAMAEEKGIAVLMTEKTMFYTCGILYENGLKEESLQ